MIERERVVESLQKVIDPELGLDIWTLGLIYDLDIEASVVDIRMTFTSIACPMGPYLVEQVRDAVSGVKGVEKVDVSVVFDPPWEPSEDLKALLGLL